MSAPDRMTLPAFADMTLVNGATGRRLYLLLGPLPVGETLAIRERGVTWPLTPEQVATLNRGGTVGLTR